MLAFIMKCRVCRAVHNSIREWHVGQCQNQCAAAILTILKLLWKQSWHWYWCILDIKCWCDCSGKCTLCGVLWFVTWSMSTRKDHGMHRRLRVTAVIFRITVQLIFASLQALLALSHTNVILVRLQSANTADNAHLIIWNGRDIKNAW